MTVRRDIADALPQLPLLVQGYDSAANSLQNSSGDVTSAIQTILNTRDFVLPYRLSPYTIGKIAIPAGRTLYISPGVRFAYNGGNGFAFTLTGSGSGIVCSGANGSTFTVECAADSPGVWAVGVGLNVSNWRVIGAMGVSCGQVSVAANVAYADVVTPKMKAAGDTRAVNQGTNGLISGGGATFNTAPDNTVSGAAFLGYTSGLVVRGCTYNRCSHGVQWWGGNADHNADGGIANERKARNYIVEGCRAYDCSGVGIWGSMGHNVKVIGGDAARCGDACFDSEGGYYTEFVACRGEDGVNGNFLSFFYNRALRWSECVSVQSKKENAHVRIYNPASSHLNDDLTWIGGLMDCNDTTGPAFIDGSLGICRQISIKGARFRNSGVKLPAGFGQVHLSGNTFVVPYAWPQAYTLIEIGINQAGYGWATTKITDNKINYETFTNYLPSGTLMMWLKGQDPNLNPFFMVSDNLVFVYNNGAASPIKLTSGGAQPTKFVVRQNCFQGEIQKNDVSGQAAGVYTIPAGSNITWDGGDVPITSV